VRIPIHQWQKNESATAAFAGMTKIGQGFVIKSLSNPHVNVTLKIAVRKQISSLLRLNLIVASKLLKADSLIEIS